MKGSFDSAGSIGDQGDQFGLAAARSGSVNLVGARNTYVQNANGTTEIEGVTYTTGREIPWGPQVPTLEPFNLGFEGGSVFFDGENTIVVTTTNPATGAVIQQEYYYDPYFQTFTGDYRYSPEFVEMNGLPVHMSQKNLLSSTSPLLLVDHKGDPVLGQLGRTNVEHAQAWDNYDNLRVAIGLEPSDKNEPWRKHVSREEQGKRNLESAKKTWEKVKDWFKGGSDDKDKAKPIDANGIQITELSQSNVFLDAKNDGLENRIAWAAVGNGVLFYDANEDGEISETREFVFTEWDPTAASDLEAIASVFDSNGDGVLAKAS